MNKNLWILIFTIALISSGLGLNQTENVAVDNGSIGKPEIVLFYSPTCPHCKEVENFLDSVEERRFELNKYEASSNPELFSSYIRNYSVSSRYAGSVPAVFIGEQYAIGSKESIELIEKKISKKEIEKGKNNSKKGTGISEIGMIGLAGLAAADSINPCALAVLLILMGSIMSGNVEKKGKAIRSGLAFVSGIFFSYFLIGFLILLGIKGIQKATSLGFESIYLLFGTLAIIVGILNLKDGIEHGLGGFVMEVPYSWRPKMKGYLKKVTDPPGAFITSILVSLFLLPCTSGPYFVAGGILSSLSWMTSLPMLLAYNLIFVSPMLAIIGAIYLGVTEIDKIKEWREENLEQLHLIAGSFILMLGIYLILKSARL